MLFYAYICHASRCLRVVHGGIYAAADEDCELLLMKVVEVLMDFCTKFLPGRCGQGGIWPEFGGHGCYEGGVVGGSPVASMLMGGSPACGNRAASLLPSDLPSLSR